MSTNLILTELKPLTSTTRFGDSVQEATLEVVGEKARITIPWEQGVWEFSGEQLPIPGTLLVVEVDDDQPRLVGVADRFYLTKK